jgi:hypothetical protein
MELSKMQNLQRRTERKIWMFLLLCGLSGLNLHAAERYPLRDLNFVAARLIQSNFIRFLPPTKPVTTEAVFEWNDAFQFYEEIAGNEASVLNIEKRSKNSPSLAELKWPKIDNISHLILNITPNVLPPVKVQVRDPERCRSSINFTDIETKWVVSASYPSDVKSCCLIKMVFVLIRSEKIAVTLEAWRPVASIDHIGSRKLSQMPELEVEMYDFESLNDMDLKLSLPNSTDPSFTKSSLRFSGVVAENQTFFLDK